MNIQQIAQKLKAVGTVSIPRQDLFDEITTMATAIHKCPRRNAAGRSYEKVFADCSHIAIEHALIKVIGGTRNPKEFDIKDKDSYIWDVQTEEDKLVEVKRHKTNAKYFTYNGKNINTYIKNCLALDYLVTGYMDSSDTAYLVDFALVADSKTFEFYFQPSNYSGHYYDHNTALRLGHCAIINLRNPVF